MMRTPCVAANWKMNNTVAQAQALVHGLEVELQDVKGVEVIVCPPFTALQAVSTALQGSQIGVGAQNMHWEKSGAFTGEVAPLMVSEFAHYVILGHSERRALFGETNENVSRKVRAALGYHLTPIVCVGETLEEYEAGHTVRVVNQQICDSLAEVELKMSPEETVPLMIAYEPVWAIGTGRAATAEGANQVIADTIRPALANLFGHQVAGAVRVLYGGSVKGSNAVEFFAKPDIDGALVGGASLKAADFAQIVRAAVR